MVLVEELIQVELLLLICHLFLVHWLDVEEETGLTSYLFSLMLVLSGWLAPFAPIDRLSSCLVWWTTLVRTGVHTLGHVDQTHFTLDAPHICFGNQLVVVLRGTLPCWHLWLIELMGVSCVRSVTLLTEGEVVTLLTVKPEMTFLDWLEAILVVTNKPHSISLILMSLVCRLDSFLFELAGNFSIEISVYRWLKIFIF